jgi:ABC-type lipoprotein release transport system permease subunit
VCVIHGYNVEVDQGFQEILIHRSMTGHIIAEAELVDGEKVDLEGATVDAIAAAVQNLEAPSVPILVRMLSIDGMIAGPKSSFRYSGIAYDIDNGNEARGSKWAWNAIYGKPLSSDASNQIAVGKGLAELIGCSISDREPLYLPDGRYGPAGENLECLGQSFQMTALTASNQINTWNGKLVGIADAGTRDLEDVWLTMPLKDAHILTNSKRISTLGITLQNPDHAFSILQALQTQFSGTTPKIRFSFWKDHNLAQIYRSMMGVMKIFEQFMLLIIGSVCILSMINTVIRNVDERMHELGTLRAIGYKRGFVIRLFAYEGFLLGVFGSTFGITVVGAISLAVDRLSILYTPAVISQKVLLRIAFTPDAYLILGILLSISAGFTAAVVAKLRISKNISETLTGTR